MGTKDIKPQKQPCKESNNIKEVKRKIVEEPVKKKVEEVVKKKQLKSSADKENKSVKNLKKEKSKVQLANMSMTDKEMDESENLDDELTADELQYKVHAGSGSIVRRKLMFF